MAPMSGFNASLKLIYLTRLSSHMMKYVWTSKHFPDIICSLNIVFELHYLFLDFLHVYYYDDT